MCTLVLSDFLKLLTYTVMYPQFWSLKDLSVDLYIPIISSGDSIFYLRKIELITKLQGSNIMSQPTPPRPSEISEKNVST